MKIVKSSCSSKRRVRTCTFSPQVNIKNKRTAIQTEQDVNAAHSEAKIQDLIDDIRSNIYTKVKAVATSPDFGFDENEVDDYFFVEASATEIGEDHHEAIRVEVRAEVSYEGLEDLMEALNPIIETYDSYAYFEPVEPGIIEAYVSVDQVDMSVYGSEDEVVASGNSEYTNRYVTKYKNKSYTIYDNSNSVNLPQDADIEALQKWKAQVTQQAGAYNDADRDYQWAKLENGVIYYYRNGKLEDKSYYMSPSDWDIEQLSEWSEAVINEAIENLYEANKDVPDRMIHNSTSIEATDSYNLDDETYEYVTNVDGYWVYRAVVDGKGVWRAMPQGSNESQFDSLSFPISYDQARGFEPIDEPSAITKLRKDLGKKLLPKAGQSVEATEDLSVYPKDFAEAYKSAKNMFQTKYPNVGISIIPDDYYAEDNEIAVLVKDYDSGESGKCYLVTEGAVSDDTDWIIQAFEETAESCGIYLDPTANLTPRELRIMISELSERYDTSDMYELRQGLHSYYGYDSESIDEIINRMTNHGLLDVESSTAVSTFSDIASSTDDKVFIEDIIDELEDNGYDLSRIRSIRRGLLELFGYKGKDADIIIHDLVAGRFIDPNDWVDKDYIPGIYSATDDGEGYWFFTTHGVQPGSVPKDVYILDIIDTPNGSFVKFDRFLSTEELNEYDMVEKAPKSVMSSKNCEYVKSSEEDEDREDLPMVDQEYDSAATSINSNKLPAIYKMVNFNEGDVVVDFGGGKFDNAVEYIKDKGATLVVYDPYNRSAEHNKEVLRILRENGGADAAVNSNVLNVIKEPEARKNVLENIARITKPGAPIYITVYEGKGDGQEGPTKSGYQLNRKTADYLEEIQEVFPDATRRGKLITAHNSGSIASSQDITAEYNIQFKRSVINELRPLLVEKLESKYGIEFFVTDMFIEGDNMHIQVYGDDKYHGDIDIPVDYSFDIWDLLEDAFNKFQELFDGKSSSPVKSYTDVEEDISRYDKDVDRYHMMDVKSVEDSDGFLTEYAMYEVRLSDGSIEYECYLGDRDLYGPWNGEGLDFESDRYDEAAEWWNDYNEFEVDDITSSTILDANPEFRNNFEEAVDFFYESYPATVELTDEVDEDYDTLYKAYVKETGSLYQQMPGIVYIDTNWDSGEILQALQETAEAIGIEQYPDDDIEMSTFSDKNDVTSSTIKASYDGKFTCRIDHYGAFDNGHVLHGDWKKMSNEEAELLAKQYSENDPENIYYVHYDNIMDPASDYVWYQGEPYMSGDLVYRGGSVDVKGVPVSEDEVLSYTSVQADYNDKNLRALEDEWLTPPEYDDPIEHEDSEELIEVEINQVITVDVDGDYEWDDDTYVWASPDGSNEEWRSEDGVYIDDKVGVVEHIDDLIIPNVPTRPGKYRVTGLAKLVYDVSGIQEYRTEYGPDDYDSDIDIDHAVVSFNFRKSEVQNLKITPVRR